MSNAGYGTGIKHLLEQAEAGQSCILSQLQVAEVAGTLVAMSNEIDQMSLVADMQARVINGAKNFMSDENWVEFLGQMGLGSDEEE